MALIQDIVSLYQWMLDKGDPRVESWLLMSTPFPVMALCLVYLLVIAVGPRLMKPYPALSLRHAIIAYNLALVLLSLYMFKEFLVTSLLSGYSYICQPVDYSNRPLALRMANACWWYFFSKIIETADTVFFILRKKNNQITFLHCYHHFTMIGNWWLGVKYIAGGQSWFLAMLNCGVHVVMYTYYLLAALNVDRRYLWWKRYLTRLQLSQFVAVIVHTSVNLMSDCDFPAGFNLCVIFYAFTLIVLFTNFYLQAYSSKKPATEPKQLPQEDFKNGHYQNGVHRKRVVRIEYQ